MTSPQSPSHDLNLVPNEALPIHKVSPEVQQRLSALNEPPEEREEAGISYVKLFIILSIGIVLLGGIGGLAWWLVKGREQVDNLIFERATRGSIVYTVVEKGEVEAANNTDIICKVRSSGRGQSTAGSIKWVIDDGVAVRKDEVLMRLDDSAIRDQIKNQEIVVQEKRTLKGNAETTLEITQSENRSNINTAKNNVELARIDLEKYEKGEYIQKRNDIDGRIRVAEAELLQWKERVENTRRLVEKGFASESQLNAEESSLRAAEIKLATVKEESRVLDGFDKRRQMLDLRNKLNQAEVAAEVAEKTAQAKQKQGEAELKKAEAVLGAEEDKLREFKEDLDNCTIKAPHAGMVVYYVPEQSRGGQQNQSTIAVGENVKESQKLFRLPDLSKMIVRVKIHEALVGQLQGDATPNASSAGDEMYTGQSARIRFANSDKTQRGHVRKVANVPSKTDWMSSDVNVYAVEVAIDDQVAGLRPGMSAEVTIYVDERTNVLKLPVQAVLDMDGNKFCYVQTADGHLEKRKVNAGLNNGKHLEILSGSEVTENDLVLVNARAYAEKSGDLQVSAKQEQTGNVKKQEGVRPQPTATGQGRVRGTGTGPRGERSGMRGERGGQMSEDQRQQMEEQRKQLMDNLRKAKTAEERKQIIDGLAVPQQAKDRIKRDARAAGLEVAD
jgi:HlyD family secretion protein